MELRAGFRYREGAEKRMGTYRNYKKNIEAVLLVCCLSAGCLLGCEQQEIIEETKEEEVKIPMILTVNPSTGKRNEETLIKAFNKEYEGKWEIEVERSMETEEDYRQNLKRQNVTDTLPAVVTDIRMLPSFYKKMIEDKRLEELSQYINQDEEWKAMIEPVVLECAKIWDLPFRSILIWSQRMFL